MKDGAVAEKTTVKEDTPADNGNEDDDQEPSVSATSTIAAAQTQRSSAIGGLILFLNETRMELTKISWPERSQVIRETLSVIVLVTVITVLVTGFDLAVAKVVFEPLDHLARYLGGGVGVHK